MDCSLWGSFVHGISQARILECVAISFCRGFSWPRDPTGVSYIVGGFFTSWIRWEKYKVGELSSYLQEYGETGIIMNRWIQMGEEGLKTILKKILK